MQNVECEESKKFSIDYKCYLKQIDLSLSI